MLTFTFADILERDMDMLFLEEFVSSEEFLKIFLSRIGIDKAVVTSIGHSQRDESGESDMIVTIDRENEKILLLIEDKINAVAQPEQAGRYLERGSKKITADKYNRYYSFIVAPNEYLEGNEEAKKYPYAVSYEEILNYFESKGDARSLFKAAQIKRAIRKKEYGYQPIVHNGVSDFWENYVRFCTEQYPALTLASSAGKKGSAATWPRFRTRIKGLYILHKSEFGYVDLTFESAKERITEIDKLIKDTFGGYEEIGASIEITGKSAALRMVVPVLDFKAPFEEQKEKVEKCFTVIEKMTAAADTLDTIRVFDILKKDTI